MNKISILKFKEIGRGALRGVFDMRLNQTTMVLRECKLFEKADTGARWIVLPQKTYVSDDKTRYFPLVEFEDKAMKERFQRSVLDALDDHLGAGR